MDKWLSHHPFTVGSRVRIPVALPVPFVLTNLFVKIKLASSYIRLTMSRGVQFPPTREIGWWLNGYGTLRLEKWFSQLTFI